MEKTEEKVVNPEEVKETSDQQIEEKVQETPTVDEEISPETETIAEEILLESEEVIDEDNFEHMLEESLANI
ncbi:MAG: hypothetical protein ISS80_02470, partial [Candidatus Cloacimonetes bacterium]|nr:hypothetical protein [Candidatus Cloacimonadota bacterium]